LQYTRGACADRYRSFGKRLAEIITKALRAFAPAVLEAPKVSAPAPRSNILQIRGLSKWNSSSVPTVKYIFNAPSYRRSMAYMQWVGLSDDIQATHPKIFERILR
jgi:hypothetical protein